MPECILPQISQRGTGKVKDQTMSSVNSNDDSQTLPSPDDIVSGSEDHALKTITNTPDQDISVASVAADSDDQKKTNDNSNVNNGDVGSGSTNTWRCSICTFDNVDSVDIDGFKVDLDCCQICENARYNLRTVQSQYVGLPQIWDSVMFSFCLPSNVTNFRIVRFVFVMV